MTDDEQILAYKHRYEAAALAMQSGVEMAIHTLGMMGETEPKRLRGGVNSALVETDALADLLLAKGVITKLEWAKALAEGMEREATDYQRRLSEAMHTTVTLG